MSTGTKTAWADALINYDRFERTVKADLSMPLTHRWSMAGSLRRRKAEVGDIEHVVIPARGDVSSGDMFATPVDVNLLWHRLDQLLDQGIIEKAVYPDGKHRWGPQQRGLLFEGMRHEIFTAGPAGFGYQLLLRTGSAAFSHWFVQELKRHGYEARGGLIYPIGRKHPVDVSDEQTCFELIKWPFVPPNAREEGPPR